MSGMTSIALSGLNDASLRASNAASNIANAFSTAPLPSSDAAYSGFQPQDVVSLSAAGGGTGPGVDSALRPRDPAYLTAAGPTSADANASGLVAMPNVDPGKEISALQTAHLSYRADATLIKTADKMQKSLLNTFS
jgi:flagellar basal-body rod protein FlgC